MRKEKPKYKVIQSVTEAEIKYFGANRWFRKRWWVGIIALVVWCFITWVACRITDSGNIRFAVVFLTAFILYSVFLFEYFRAGKKYFKQVKDKPQPFELD